MPGRETRANQINSANTSLKERCFQAVRTHFSVLGTQAVLGLPTSVIKDLMPHLTVCQLDELQPELNKRGVSTYAGWFGVLTKMYSLSHALDFKTEDEAKHEVMRMLFVFILYGYRNHYVSKNITNLNNKSFLWTAAKYTKHFAVYPTTNQGIQKLTSDLLPVLAVLEKHVRSVYLNPTLFVSDKKSQTSFYVLHRLLDHGVATKLIVYADCPIVLAWLLHGRGSQYVHPELEKLMQHSPKTSSDVASHSPCPEVMAPGDQDEHSTPCKRFKLDSASTEKKEESGESSFSVNPRVLCQIFTPCAVPSAGACSRGQIDCLEIRNCESISLKVLISALPTFFCLRSLTLHSVLIFKEADVLDLAVALKELSGSSYSSLADLNISVLPHSRLMRALLDSFPRLKSLHVESQTTWGPQFIRIHPLTTESDLSELPLEKLTVKLTEPLSDLHLMTSLLRRCPHLTTLHLAGMRLPSGSTQSQLLITLSESNPCLKVLNFEDMKLCDCLPDILKLLRDCKLEELRLSDCRLLEKCTNQEDSLLQLVAAVKMVPSLHKLSLAQNRIAKKVYMLAELFSGSSLCSVKHLDISSNYIQPADLLQFAETLRSRHPPRVLSLDLRKNPGDRDPDTWNKALQVLQPFTLLLD